jgi:hypothetical protein
MQSSYSVQQSNRSVQWATICVIVMKVCINREKLTSVSYDRGIVSRWGILSPLRIDQHCNARVQQIPYLGDWICHERV